MRFRDLTINWNFVLILLRTKILRAISWMGSETKISDLSSHHSDSCLYITYYLNSTYKFWKLELVLYRTICLLTLYFNFIYESLKNRPRMFWFELPPRFLLNFQIIDQTYMTRRFFAEAVASQVKPEAIGTEKMSNSQII